MNITIAGSQPIRVLAAAAAVAFVVVVAVDCCLHHHSFTLSFVRSFLLDFIKLYNFYAIFVHLWCAFRLYGFVLFSILLLCLSRRNATISIRAYPK